LVNQAISGQPLTVFGDGEQSRCFCHVHDVVDALLRLLGDERAYGEVFNIGAEREITILDLAKMIVERTGSSSSIRLVPYEDAYAEGFEDMKRRVPSTKKLRELTGWETRHSLEDILDDTIARARADREASAEADGLIE